MHIGLIGSARFGTDEPYAGGLESHVSTLAAHLEARGHTVALLPGCSDRFIATEVARRDVSAAPDAVLAEHHAYLSCLLELAASDIQVLHNHSLHYLPLAMAPAMRQPMVTTLHSPPTPWLESALLVARNCTGPIVSVSRANAEQWTPVLGTCRVITNGVDVDRFRRGPGGGGHAAWFGRLVPEKGVELAIAAARTAGIPLRIAGPIHDEQYFASRVEPWLGEGVTYEGHLDSDGLNELVGTAEVSVITPRWDEPFGLVVAESLAMGTPVAAFGRGGVPEVLTDDTGRLVPPDDVEALAVAIGEASGLDRDACRRHAVQNCNIATMVDEYEALYEACLEEPSWHR
jgi:glycosyltransferase involved in cell wall biosynthesis